MSRTRVYERELLKNQLRGNATSNPAYPNNVHSGGTKSSPTSTTLSEKKYRSSLNGSTEAKTAERDAIESSANQTDSKDGNLKPKLKRSKLGIVKDWSTGVEEFKKGNYAAALDLFKGIGNSKLLYNVGATYKKLEKYFEALEAYKESIKRDKYLVVSYFEGGNCGVILNQLHEALDMYSKAYELLRGNLNIDYSQLGMSYKLSVGDILYNRIIVYCKLGMYPYARTDCQILRNNSLPFEDAETLLDGTQHVNDVQLKTADNSVFAAPKVSLKPRLPRSKSEPPTRPTSNTSNTEALPTDDTATNPSNILPVTARSSLPQHSRSHEISTENSNGSIKSSLANHVSTRGGTTSFTSQQPRPSSAPAPVSGTKGIPPPPSTPPPPSVYAAKMIDIDLPRAIAFPEKALVKCTYKDNRIVLIPAHRPSYLDFLNAVENKFSVHRSKVSFSFEKEGNLCSMQNSHDFEVFLRGGVFRVFIRDN